MSLMYLTDRALAQLRHDCERNRERYSLPDPWLSDSSAGPGWCRESGVSVSALPQLDHAKPESDLENTRLVHGALRMLTPVQAMDERLWAYLAHVTYWRYMRERWGAANIAGRYFFKNRGISGLTLNGISRLWWFGHLTYDTNRADPYEMTRVLLSNQDIQTGLLQRTIGRSATVRRALLSYLSERRSEIERRGASRCIQILCRDLNLFGGACLLDVLSADAVASALDGSLGAVKASSG